MILTTEDHVQAVKKEAEAGPQDARQASHEEEKANADVQKTAVEADRRRRRLAPKRIAGTRTEGRDHVAPLVVSGR